MFELSGATSIRGNSGPLVRPEIGLKPSQIYHGLDGENVAWLHDTLGLGVYVDRFMDGWIDR